MSANQQAKGTRHHDETENHYRDQDFCVMKPFEVKINRNKYAHDDHEHTEQTHDEKKSCFQLEVKF
ncbi:hypothetical protein JCM14469_25400 [Desulfatiferula olefinivorans]